MPELPEVEVVRAGLDERATGAVITGVEVRHPRSVRRHVAGPADFAGRLRDRRIEAVCRRGKFLWLRMDDGDALFAHLGMSGQFHARSTPRVGVAEPSHLRVRIELTGVASTGELWFVDQRMFGGLWVASADPDGAYEDLVHIAPDPLESAFDSSAVVEAIRARRTNIKRALLDQTLISGIGNIYADEALWRARLHYARPTRTLRRTELERLLASVRDVLLDALAAGGTSFDALYVDVNGDPGYFARELAVYGAEGEPCPACGTAVRRDRFMNRSSYTCPRCQPRPRNPHW